MHGTSKNSFSVRGHYIDRYSTSDFRFILNHSAVKEKKLRKEKKCFCDGLSLIRREEII